MKAYFILFFLFSLFFLVDAFAIQYYINNAGYHAYVMKYFNDSDTIDLYNYNISFYDGFNTSKIIMINKAITLNSTDRIKADANNMRYQPLLLNIIRLSSVLSSLLFLTAYLYKRKDLKTSISSITNGESRGNRTGENETA